MSMALFLSESDFLGDLPCYHRFLLEFSSTFLSFVSRVEIVGFCPLGSFSIGFTYNFFEKSQLPKPPWILLFYINRFFPSLFSFNCFLKLIMGDNLRRKMQDISLGVNESPIAVPRARSLCPSGASELSQSLVLWSIQGNRILGLWSISYHASRNGE